MTTREHQARRYVFAALNPLRYRQQCGARALSLPTATPTALTLDAIISEKNLMRIFERLQRSGGTAPGIDGVRYDEAPLSILESARCA